MNSFFRPMDVVLVRSIPPEWRLQQMWVQHRQTQAHCLGIRGHQADCYRPQSRSRNSQHQRWNQEDSSCNQRGRAAYTGVPGGGPHYPEHQCKVCIRYGQRIMLGKFALPLPLCNWSFSSHVMQKLLEIAYFGRILPLNNILQKPNSPSFKIILFFFKQKKRFLFPSWIFPKRFN